MTKAQPAARGGGDRAAMAKGHAQRQAKQDRQIAEDDAAIRKHMTDTFLTPVRSLPPLRRSGVWPNPQ